MVGVLPLKILGLADLHDHIERLDELKDIDADLIVFCGDLHNGSHRKEATPVAAALACLGPPVLIVPGNMDHKDVVPDLWSEAGFIMLHQTIFRHGDYGFLGLGGMVARDPRRLEDPARYYHRDEEVYRILAAAYPKISGKRCKIIDSTMAKALVPSACVASSKSISPIYCFAGIFMRIEESAASVPPGL
jgi:Icc-related predicted phosphoesterase